MATPTTPSAPATSTPISPAVYNDGNAYDITPIGVEEPAASEGWRSPQIPSSGGMQPVTQASYTAPVSTSGSSAANGQQPIAASVPEQVENPNPMPVQLRAVTPPPTQQVMQPVYNPPPRMRFPNFFGWAQPQPQPQPVVATAITQQATAATVPATSSDGFRPRGSSLR